MCPRCDSDGNRWPVEVQADWRWDWLHQRVDCPGNTLVHAMPAQSAMREMRTFYVSVVRSPRSKNRVLFKIGTERGARGLSTKHFTGFKVGFGVWLLIEPPF